VLLSETRSKIRVPVFYRLKDLTMFTPNLFHHLLRIGFKRPGEMNSRAQMIQKKSLYGNEVVVLCCAGNCQMKGQIRFDCLCDGQVRPRGGGVHFLKEFDFFCGPTDGRDPRGSSIEPGPDF
jgi:hypothetical protein